MPAANPNLKPQAPANSQNSRNPQIEKNPVPNILIDNIPIPSILKLKKTRNSKKKPAPEDIEDVEDRAGVEWNTY